MHRGARLEQAWFIRSYDGSGLNVVRHPVATLSERATNGFLVLNDSRPFLSSSSSARDGRTKSER